MTVSKQVWRRRAPRLTVDRPGRLSGRASQTVHVLELSLTGCLIRCGTLLDIGAIQDLEITLDDGPLPAKVRVADASVDGSAQESHRQECLAGLEFMGLPAQQAARLRRFLDEERRRRSADASPR
jgi:PilZ domain-containing protein